MDPLAVSAEPIVKIEAEDHVEVHFDDANNVDWATTDVVEVEVDVEEVDELIEELSTIPGLQTEIFRDEKSMKILSVADVIRKAEGYISDEEDENEEDEGEEEDEPEEEPPIPKLIRIKREASSRLSELIKSEPLEQYDADDQDYEPEEYDLPANDNDDAHNFDDDLDITHEDDLVNELRAEAQKNTTKKEAFVVLDKLEEINLNDAMLDPELVERLGLKRPKLELVKLHKYVFRVLSQRRHEKFLVKLNALIDKHELKEKYRDITAPLEIAADKIL